MANVMEWLHPTNIEDDYVLYASQIVFELMYDDHCIKEKKSNECFRVHTLWRGQPLAFKECKWGEDGTGCSYEDFMVHMNNIWYDGANSDDLDEACNQTMRPYGEALLQ